MSPCPGLPASPSWCPICPLKIRLLSGYCSGYAAETEPSFYPLPGCSGPFFLTGTPCICVALVADQSPGGPENSYWLNFFGRPTPFVRGAERGARIGDIPAVFVRIYQSSRGHYRVHLTTLAEHPRELPEGELTRRYRTMLEAAIRLQPESWLWSHKRWKYSWNEGLAPFWMDEEKK